MIFLTGSLITSQAQKPVVGFSGGVVFANYKAKLYGESVKGNSKTGINAGLFVDFPLNTHFSFQPALNFVQKGTAEREIYLGIRERTSLRINSMEVTVNFLYNVSGNTGNFFIGGGPSLAFHLSGKRKNNEGTQPYFTDLKFGNSKEDTLRRMDFGANFLTGYSFPNGLMLAVNYNLGLSNLFTDKNENSILKSNYIAIKLGFLLNRMKNRK